MAHELEINADGTARFAYADREIPWHRLGTPMKGLQTLDAMLEAAQANYSVNLTKIAVINDDGTLLLDAEGNPIIIEDSRATIRDNKDGTYRSLATVGTRYEVRQNEEVMERALAVIGASRGEAILDTCGVLKDGARFFATIDLGSLVIDPMGVADKIGRYLVISTGHDGVWPIRYANTDIRAVCNNTVILGLQKAERVFTARHTRNVDASLEDARTALNVSIDWATGFKAEAERMLTIPVPLSSKSLDRVIDAAFPPMKNETDRQRRNRQDINGVIRSLYVGKRNAGEYGFNGWSAYNAVGEYLDHHRDNDKASMAIASMDDTSWVTRKKLATQKAVLSLL
jgi:phage/plasmid-like protein (TIGR03299 family)